MRALVGGFGGRGWGGSEEGLEGGKGLVGDVGWTVDF